MKKDSTRGVITALMTFLVSGLLCSQVVVEEQLSRRITGYQLDVTLDDKAGIVSGTIDAFWVNTSPQPAMEARLHMYMNAFRSNRTTYNGIAGIEPYKEKSDFGWIDFLTAFDGSGNDLMKYMEYIAPDDGNQYDKTVLKVSLPEPVMPGDTLRIRGTFETKLPSRIRRTGYNKDFFFVAQWFPKFGVWQPDSDRLWAWNCHQFHQTSEFYSDHSVYDVSITLPEKYVVGTGGIIQKEESLPDGLKRQLWRAEDIVDFAWTAWPHYQVIHDRWNHVAITLLIPPGRKSQIARHLGAVKNTLEFMTDNLGPYPWPHVTVVDPPMAGQGSGGMEYTTLFTSSGMDFVPRWAHIPEMVTSHELGHAWFMGILATNEFEEPWLDEGINSFYEQRIMDRYYGDGSGMFNHPLLRVSDRSFGRLQYVLSGVKQVADNTPYSWQFPQGSYSMMSYSKAALWLQSLMGLVGEETVNEIFREYYRRWSFGHPSADDFIEVVNDVVPKFHGSKFGDDMNWFFEQTLFSSGICDYKVHRFYQTKVYPYTGIEREDDSTFIVRSDSLRDVMTYRSVVNLQRTGEVILPVEVRVGLSNGEEVTMMWDGRERYKDLIFEYEEDIKVNWVRIDPDFKNPLDINIRNNFLTSTPDNKPLIRFARKLTFLIQMIINFVMI